MATASATTARTYVDFVPSYSLQEEPDKVALRVDLSAEGMKEQIKVQIDNFGRLRIAGERPLGADGSRWKRFHKEFQVPDTCDAAAIRARLDKDGILLITMPKLSPAAAAAEEPQAPGADMGGDAATGQDHEPAGHTSAQQAGTAAEEEKGQEQEDAGAAMDRPGQDDERHTSGDNATAAPAPAARRPAAYGFAKDRRRMLLAIFAVVLALVGAGLLERYRLAMDQSAATAPSGNHIISLSDS
ncbi:inactive protein RESTRICTED TEV MOVEMENT 2-like [Panicum miliaceum]|uniref:Inactive protein RESTRICTED TEV MOVEMENT 2-like n=1 Tax=Panicum miliaceum TaxID=4540 RepID=A0A3L6TU76_PANMI|nr:inactive protein RESTRICTED TEV MOVEMENT 2-like [Panicum miliaceum]